MTFKEIPPHRPYPARCGCIFERMGDQPISRTFDGRLYTGYATLVLALCMECREKRGAQWGTRPVVGETYIVMEGSQWASVDPLALEVLDI